jgi:hypothetical protein
MHQPVSQSFEAEQSHDKVEHPDQAQRPGGNLNQQREPRYVELVVGMGHHVIHPFIVGLFKARRPQEGVTKPSGYERLEEGGVSEEWDGRIF